MKIQKKKNVKKQHSFWNFPNLLVIYSSDFHRMVAENNKYDRISINNLIYQDMFVDIMPILMYMIYLVYAIM